MSQKTEAPVYNLYEYFKEVYKTLDSEAKSVPEPKYTMRKVK